ncbi:hypothetical protein GH714_000309 [Hevea brasiliensis]|uniref:Leucine-rich repeat-containing N-terminal plant-type domain-containing protein n=1 Tax=Hevea brasiliensis TaxID=3981 RepID=A0A6A6NAD5_HEVBR|nr:hypothetical protein GH714_000309 [Hevea brasiliensis]
MVDFILFENFADFIFVVSMEAMHFHLLAFVFWCLCMRTGIGYNSNSSVGEVQVMCIEREKQALLKFKDGLVDYANELSSWVAKKRIAANGVGFGATKVLVMFLRLTFVLWSRMSMEDLMDTLQRGDKIFISGTAAVDIFGPEFVSGK